MQFGQLMTVGLVIAMVGTVGIVIVSLLDIRIPKLDAVITLVGVFGTLTMIYALLGVGMGFVKI